MGGQYPIETTFVSREFLSCTTSIETLERFLGRTGVRILFKIKSYSGKDIQRHWCFQTVDEVLLPTAIKFQIISNYRELTDLRVIELKEIAPTSSLPMNISRDLLSSQNGFPNTTDPSNTLQDLNFKQIIARSKPHTWIDLSHQQLTDQDMETVAQRAIIDKQCNALDLGSNNVTSQGVSILCTALCNCTSLKRLYLSDNQIADDGVEQLALSVENSTLAVLGLSKNGITDVGTQHLGKMLMGNRHLTVLGLEDNKISDQGVELLANALKYNKKLERLYLAENNRISDSSFDALVDMLQHNHSLYRLDLRACRLSNSAKTRLQAVVQTKTNFQLLY